MNWLDKLNDRPRTLQLGHSQVEFLNWSYATHLPSNVPHRHAHFEVCQVGSHGRGVFMAEGAEYSLEPYDLFVARPGVLHQIINTSKPDMELFWFSFVWRWEVETVPDVLDTWLRGFHNLRQPVAPDSEGQLAALWHALRTTGGVAVHPGQDAQLSGIMSALLLAVVDLSKPRKRPGSPPGPSNSKRRVQMAMRYIRDNLDRRLPVDEVASQLNVSTRHMARLFKSETGLSPTSYIETERHKLAKQLLKTGVPIKSVASATGYRSVHHFTRAFACHAGQPPGAFRDDVLPRL